MSEHSSKNNAFPARDTLRQARKHLNTLFLQKMRVPMQFSKYNTIASIFMFFILGATAAHAILPPPSTGNIYVGNFGAGNVTVYDSTGAFLRTFTGPGVSGARGIVIAPNRKLYLSSEFTSEIFVFGPGETFEKKFNHAELSGPTGIAISDADELYVCSFNKDQVVVFDLDGNFLRTFTGTGLDGPNCVATDSQGNIFVSSAITGTVLKFDPNENFIKNFTGGGLLSPMSIARNLDDVLYVSGGGSNNIVKFDNDGTFLGVITHPDLPVPQGIAFDERGHFFVTSFTANQAVEFDENDNYVQTITEGGLQVPRSVAFEQNQPVTAINDSEPGIPAQFDLSQNFPNPFNPSTKIRFQIPPGGGIVKLRIFDILGRLVATLLDGRQSGGIKTVTWDGRDQRGRAVSTGVYFYQLTAGGFSRTRKMLLVR